MNSFKKYAILGLALNLAGFGLGFAGQGLYQLGIVSLNSRLATLEPFGDLLFGFGLVMVVATSARSGADMKYIAIAGAVVGIGLFYKSALHEIHMASGLGLGLPHAAHVGLGAILIAISTTALAVLTLRSKKEVELTKSV